MGCVNTKQDAQVDTKRGRRSTNTNRTKASFKSQKSNSTKSNSTRTNSTKSNSTKPNTTTAKPNSNKSNSTKSKKSSNNNNESVKKSTIVKSKFVDLTHNSDIVAESISNQNKDAIVVIAAGLKDPKGLVDDKNWVYEKREIIKGRDRLDTKVNNLVAKSKSTSEKQMPKDKSDLTTSKLSGDPRQSEPNVVKDSEIYTNVKPEIMKEIKHEQLVPENVDKVKVNKRELAEAVQFGPDNNPDQSERESKNSHLIETNVPNDMAAMITNNPTTQPEEPKLTTAIADKANAAMDYLSNAWNDIKEEAVVIKDKVTQNNGTEYMDEKAKEIANRRDEIANRREADNYNYKVAQDEAEFREDDAANGREIDIFKNKVVRKRVETREEGANEAAYLLGQIAKERENANLKDKVAQKATEFKDEVVNEATYLKDKVVQKGTKLKDEAGNEAAYLKDKVVQKGTEYKDEAANEAAYLQERLANAREDAESGANYDSNNNPLSPPDQIIEQ